MSAFSLFKAIADPRFEMPKAKNEKKPCMMSVQRPRSRKELIRRNIEMTMEHGKWIEGKNCDVSGDGTRWVQTPANDGYKIASEGLRTGLSIIQI